MGQAALTAPTRPLPGGVATAALDHLPVFIDSAAGIPFRVV